MKTGWLTRYYWPDIEKLYQELTKNSKIDSEQNEGLVGLIVACVFLTVIIFFVALRANKVLTVHRKKLEELPYPIIN